MLLVRLAWRNLGRNRRRTALTAGAAVFATVLCMLNLAVSAGSQKRWIANAVELYPGHFEVSERGYRDNRTLDYALTLGPEERAALDALAPEAGWTARLEAFGLISADTEHATGRGLQLLGVDAARERGLSRLLGALTPGSAAPAPGARELALGDLLGRNLGVSIGDSVIAVSADAFGSQTADRFRVVGTFHVGGDELDGFAAIADLRALQEFLAVGEGVSHAAVFAARGAPLPAIQARLDAAFPADRFEVLGWPELVPELVSFMKLNDVGDWMQNALLLIVVVFGLLNTVLMSVFERVREFGVLRALGLRPRAVFGLVMLESVFLSLLGIAIGFAIGVPLVLWLGNHPVHLVSQEMRSSLEVFGLEPLIMFSLSKSQLVGLPLVLLAVGLVAAVLPAIRASRGRPVDALRET
jgi:putative ABC transport system permease protein